MYCNPRRPAPTLPAGDILHITSPTLASNTSAQKLDSVQVGERNLGSSTSSNSNIQLQQGTTDNGLDSQVPNHQDLCRARFNLPNLTEDSNESIFSSHSSSPETEAVDLWDAALLASEEMVVETIPDCTTHSDQQKYTRSTGSKWEDYASLRADRRHTPRGYAFLGNVRPPIQKISGPESFVDPRLTPRSKLSFLTGIELGSMSQSSLLMYSLPPRPLPTPPTQSTVRCGSYSMLSTPNTGGSDASYRSTPVPPSAWTVSESTAVPGGPRSSPVGGGSRSSTTSFPNPRLRDHRTKSRPSSPAMRPPLPLPLDWNNGTIFGPMHSNVNDNASSSLPFPGQRSTTASQFATTSPRKQRRSMPPISDLSSSPSTSPVAKSSSSIRHQQRYSANVNLLNRRPSDVEASSRRFPFAPRSAVPNYFNLDFSFLEDEPPPETMPSKTSTFQNRRGVPEGTSTIPEMTSSFKSTRRSVNGTTPHTARLSRNRTQESDGDDDNDDIRSPLPAIPEPSRNSFITFPARPGILRRQSSDSMGTTSQSASMYSVNSSSTARRSTSGTAPSVPLFSGNPGTLATTNRSGTLETSVGPSHQHGPSHDLRRPSQTSFESTGSSTLSSSGHSGGRLTSDFESPTAVQFPLPSTHSQLLVPSTNTQEQRKRLAQFLDDTASAMEGGKSLAMVLPEADASVTESVKTLGELAEEAASPHSNSSTSRGPTNMNFLNYSLSPKSSESSADERRLSPHSSLNGGMPGRFSSPPETPIPRWNTNGHGGRTKSSQENRASIYFTPEFNQQLTPSSSESEDQTMHAAPEVAERGLGFSVPASSLAVACPRSPSTVRAGSPSASPFVRSPSITDNFENPEEVEKIKMTERRHRVIRELIETEASYAIDMAVVRDIYLARARGADMSAIADHVMSTGLGLGSGVNESPSPSPPMPSVMTLSIGEENASKSIRRSVEDLRRTSTAPSLSERPVLRSSVSDFRRPSVASIKSSRSDRRRPSMAPIQLIPLPGQAVMSSKDIHVVFANLEEIATLAEAFSGVLDASRGTIENGTDDSVGSVFMQMLPQVQKLYSNYCVRHHRAILRLQELEPNLRGYLAECKTLSHGRTNAWDLASLLIKPVQRCLKYPLLLDQILAVTPLDHPDRSDLQRANHDMLMVAEHINEFKKRSDTVSRIVNKKDINARRESTKSISSMGNSVTKKILRSSQRAKSAIGLGHDAEKDDMFDTLAALVDSTRSAVLRFSGEMRDWSRNTKSALEAQVTLVEGWIDLYAPLVDEVHLQGGGYERLCVFLDTVLLPIIEEPWRELDYDIRRSLLLKTDHLLSLFENPRSVISKRNDKLLDHSRFMAKKQPSDRKGSDDFQILSAQLLEELPRFLGSVSRYFNIIIGHFAAAQAIYHEAVQDCWQAFADEWVVQIPPGGYTQVEESYAQQHQPVAQMMDTLAAGLGITPSQDRQSYPKRFSRSSGANRNSMQEKRLSDAVRHPSPVSSGLISNHFVSSAEQYRAKRASQESTLSQRQQRDSRNRNSITSDSSTPSFTVSSNGGSSTGAPSTPPLPSTGIHEIQRSSKRASSNSYVDCPPFGNSTSPTYDMRSSGYVVPRHEQALPPIPLDDRGYRAGNFRDSHQQSKDSEGPSSSTSYENSLWPGKDESRRRRNSAERHVFENNRNTVQSVYLPAEEGYEADEESRVLYIAEAMCSSRSAAFRSGHPVLSFDAGDQIQVELEEADRAEGGSGWLLGRTADGRLGWGRTEDFHMVIDGEGEDYGDENEDDGQKMGDEDDEEEEEERTSH